MNLDKFKGVFCALNAIYDENDNIDVEKIKALVRVYKSLGVKGVYACGSTGEGFLLSTEERKQVAKAVKEAAGDDFTVIVHIGCASTKESIELAKDCESLGVDAISAVPCVYYHLSEESVKLHWNSIIESTSLPFIIYNIPQLTGFNLSPELLAEMAKNPKVIGVKNSAEPVFLMERYRSAVKNDDFIIFNGSDEQFVGGRLMGANAGICGTYGCMPELGIECGEPRSPFLPVEREDAKPIADKINKYVSEIN